MQPTPTTPSVKQVPLLTASQIAQFKRDGFLVLPAVLDPELCHRARDEMWAAIATHLPRIKRDDPSTWKPITEEESAELNAQRPRSAATPISTATATVSISATGRTIHARLGPRALWQVPEQMLGEGTVVWPLERMTLASRGVRALCATTRWEG